MNYQVFATAQAAVNHIAEEFKRYSQLGRAIHISLSGGSTPKLLFQALAKSPYNTEIQWQNLHFWWGDERCVPPTDAESNYGEVQRLLFDHIAMPNENIHRIYGELSPEQGLARFEQDLQTIPSKQDNLPVFDWIILGMGTDGHTASLFPHQTNFADPNVAVIAKHPETGQVRISKTASLLEKAKRITYLVTGASKAEILKEIHENSAETLPYPAAKIKAKNGITEWYLDKEAAALL
ncbi:6-phosphogluconolactonase [Gallibacterium trehalosifermentans]|uniref:6-phosphogluconolactonase n=1 Tax=Gallibacterium trehalosifermentans TaxID=516935 RepID=A0ABV6H094_9PAST